MQKHTRKTKFLLLLLIAAFIMPFGLMAAEKKNYVVVIDAGHGGNDCGAVDNGLREKDLNLAVALKVGEKIKKKMPNVKVVYTRNDDKFVSLQGRADKANKSKADLFISIHTNSVAASNPNRKNVAGASVYTLGAQKDDQNMAVAQRENAVIRLENNSLEKYDGFDPNSDESYIIFEMAQKKNLSQSIKFAKEVQTNLVKIAGRNDRGVHQAGFWVLWATSMPSVLVEMDFICNPESAKFLNSKNGQEDIAEAIFKAVKTYFTNPGLMTADEPEIEDGEVKSQRAAKRRAETQVQTSGDTQQHKKASSGKRRRRSERAAKESENRDVAVAEVIVGENSDYALVEAAPQAAQQDKKTQDKKKQKKEQSQKKKNKGSKQEVKEDQSKNRYKKSHSKKEKSKTVYAIRMVVSDKVLSSNNPIFGGFEPIVEKKEHNLYKYYYGESENKAEIEALLKEVKAKVPDAKVEKMIKIETQE